MMAEKGFIERFSVLGEDVRRWLRGEGGMPGLDVAVARGAAENRFFTPYMQRRALQAVADGFLQEVVLSAWYNALPAGVREPRSKKPVCGIVAAGNIPAVAFQDILCVLACGWKPIVKLSSKDRHLLPVLFPDVEFCESTDGWRPDALLSMGSDAAAAYFEARFPDVPKVLRTSRFSCAILDGRESVEQLTALAEDMLLYYGLGCRSVTCLLVPEKYDFGALSEAVAEFAARHCGRLLLDNYRRNRAVMTLAGERFVDGGAVVFADVRDAFSGAAEDISLCTPADRQLPLGAVWVVEYASKGDVEKFLGSNEDRIQKIYRTFGSAQHPALGDYPDGVDVPAFLVGIANTIL